MRKKRIFVSMKHIIAILSALLLTAGAPPVTFDKTVHDFGEVSWKDGALKCNFTLTNNSQDTLDIYAAISSCGCTDVEWTRTPIAPGGKGTVSATYANEDGAYPFDKTVTVYTSAQKKPFVLHLKGVVK